LKKTTQMDPNFPEARWVLADAFAQKKMYSEAVAEWQTAMKLLGNEPGAAALGEAYKSSGYQGSLQKTDRTNCCKDRQSGGPLLISHAFMPGWGKKTKP